MKVTKDVVKDLLTVYLAGEATADTRALVEEWLREDPELARQVDRARQAELPPVPPPPVTAEKRALERTRRQWRWRAILFGTAGYFTLLPLSFTFDSEGFRGLLIQDWPQRMVVLALAAALWVFYWRVTRRVRV